MPTEAEEQILLATWLGKMGIRFYAIPNGGKRDYLEAAKLKRCGTSAGVPDICIPLPSGPYHGLYIELKRASGGKASNHQIDWLNYLRNNNYYAEICHGFDEAKIVVLHYLSLTPKAA